MAIDFTSLFARLGKIGKVMYLTHQHQAALPAAYESLLDLYGDDEHEWAGALASQVPGLVLSTAGLLPDLQATAENTLLGTVQADVPSVRTVRSALTELARQMAAESESVKASTVSATPTAIGTPVGNGFLVTSVKRADGLQQDLARVETARLVCDVGGYVNGTAGGTARLLYTGQALGDRWSYNGPGGSGARAAISVSSASTTGTNNLVTNGTFSNWIADGSAMPSGWTLDVGTLATHFQISGPGNAYEGVLAAQFNAGATLTAISQQLTLSDLRPLTSYAVGFQIRRLSTALTAGVLTVDLVDGSGNVTQDDQGVNNSTTFDLTGTNITTTYGSRSAVFRTPRLFPSSLRLRFRVSTAVDQAFLIDHIAMAPMVQLYTGGPSLAAFAGSTPFAVGDSWNLAVANNWGGSTHGATFQLLFDRLYETRQAGILLPTNASPTQADTQITA